MTDTPLPENTYWENTLSASHGGVKPDPYDGKTPCCDFYWQNTDWGMVVRCAECGQHYHLEPTPIDPSDVAGDGGDE